MQKENPNNEKFKANSKYKYGVVVSKWYKKEYTEKMLNEASDCFKKFGAKLEKIIWVPGSYELPLGAQKLIDKGLDAILVLGVVIRGETSHYDHVCSTTSNGIMKVSLDNKKPVIFGLLTCENHKQVKERLNKVEDWVRSTIEICEI